MRKTEHASAHRSISPAREVTKGSVRPANAGANSMDGMGSSQGPGIRDGYDFARIPIFSTSPETPRSMPVVTMPTEKVEREADRMAREVLHRLTEAGGQRETKGSGERAMGSSLQEGEAGGQPLAQAARTFFEPRFGIDLSRVRIFSDSRSACEAASINAQAFTTGDRIVFSHGAYAPETAAGRALLAHELAHVVQQRTSQAPSNRLYRSPQENPELTPAEVQRLAEEMNNLAAKNAWAGVDRTYRQLETFGDGAFALASDPAALHFLGAQAARNLGDIRRYKSLVQRAKTALLAAGRPADDVQLQTMEAELTAIDQAYGAVSIAPRSKRSANAKKGEPVGPELVPAAMPFAGDQRVSIERARTQIQETGSFSGLLLARAYTLRTESFTVIAGTNVPAVLWGT